MDYITARELGQYLKKLVYGDAAARGHTQRPVDGEIYGTGDFVFVPDLEKKGREIGAEVDALEAEMARLKRLKEEATKAQNQSMKRQIERLQLIKEAELKHAQIRKWQKEEAVKRQRLAALEAERLEKDRKRRETENEQRLTMLRTQAERMRQDLSQSSTGGATIESAVLELKKIKAQRDKIHLAFTTELRKQTQTLTEFYDKKIARIEDLPPWDKEFETEKDYRARVEVAKRKATPIEQAKEEKLASLKYELWKLRDSQMRPLDKQSRMLQQKRFPLPASEVSFKFQSYKLKGEVMLGELTVHGTNIIFLVPIPKAKAREYKYHPELLVPEVLFWADLGGKRFDKIIFHGPGENETYSSFQTKLSDDGQYVAYANGIVKDMKTELEWKVGPDKDINWNEARSWVKSLNLDGGGWRMPTMGELEGLYKSGAGSHNLTPLLKATSETILWVWSGETKGSSAARYFTFYNGYRFWRNRATSNTTRALAVRSRNDG